MISHALYVVLTLASAYRADSDWLKPIILSRPMPSILLATMIWSMMAETQSDPMKPVKFSRASGKKKYGSFSSLRAPPSMVCIV